MQDVDQRINLDVRQAFAVVSDAFQALVKKAGVPSMELVQIFKDPVKGTVSPFNNSHESTALRLFSHFIQTKIKGNFDVAGDALFAQDRDLVRDILNGLCLTILAENLEEGSLSKEPIVNENYRIFDLRVDDIERADLSMTHRMCTDEEYGVLQSLRLGLPHRLLDLVL